MTGMEQIKNHTRYMHFLFVWLRKTDNLGRRF